MQEVRLLVALPLSCYLPFPAQSPCHRRRLRTPCSVSFWPASHLLLPTRGNENQTYSRRPRLLFHLPPCRPGLPSAPIRFLTIVLGATWMYFVCRPSLYVVRLVSSRASHRDSLLLAVVANVS